MHSVRVLHASCASPFAVLMKIISAEIDSSLKGLHHMCASCDDYVSKIEQVKVPVGTRLCKFDVNNSFKAIILISLSLPFLISFFMTSIASRFSAR